MTVVALVVWGGVVLLLAGIVVFLARQLWVAERDAGARAGRRPNEPSEDTGEAY